MTTSTAGGISLVISFTERGIIPKLKTPTVIVSLLAVRVEASSDPTPFWNLPVISTTYAASKATDFYSPVPRIGIAANYFERMASLFLHEVKGHS